MGDPIPSGQAPWRPRPALARPGPARPGSGQSIYALLKRVASLGWPTVRPHPSRSNPAPDPFGHFLTLQVTTAPVPPVTPQACPTTGH